ncbi:MAG: hypothetical protein PWR23_1082 [Peptostreptococcaceae bacterium]|jgi:RND family efflux transporter MFP subunit|nr:hypothetical protein [Peptostreptococcaceae bacterium]
MFISKKYSKIYVLFAGMLLFSYIMVGCSKQEEIIEEIVKPIKIDEVSDNYHQEVLSLSGNVVPRKIVKVGFKNPGLIENIDIEEGDFISEGKKIAKIDTTEYELQVRASSAELESASIQIDTEIPAKVNQAKAQLELTELMYERILTLYEAGAATKAQLDEISAKKISDENTYKLAVDAEVIARSKLKKAEAGLELSKTQLSDTIIYSPINGIVISKLSQAGELVAKGYPVAVIGDIHEVDVEIGISDKDISNIKIGQEVDVYIYGLEKSFKGKVNEISATADPKTRTFAVKIGLSNNDFNIRPGMIAKVDIPLKSTKGVFIPLSSVLSKGDKELVYLYDETNQTVKSVEIETGKIINDTITVISGLNSGDKVVVDGQYRLQDSDKVKIKE